MNTSSARALLRIGRRNVARSRWRSALVVVLILLPVAGMVGTATLLKTSTPSPERVATHRMGTADLLVSPGEGGNEQALRSKLPAGSRLEPILATSGTLVVPGLAVSVTVASEDPNGLARGMLVLTTGRWPTVPGELGVTRSFAKLAGASIGSLVEIRELGPQTVVGFVEDELQLGARLALADPSLARTAGPDKGASWLVALPAGTDPGQLDPVLSPASGSTGAPQFIVTSRSQTLEDAGSLGPTTIVLGGLALLDAALVAAAAFAVGVRRRQRELGLLAAAGATPRQLAGSLLAEALVLGGLGAAAGSVVGVAGGLAISPFLDDLTGHRNPALLIDPTTIIVAVAMGLLAALAAALAPAWSAARVSVLTALSGRRPPMASA
ncbi:MAG TPA: ABC transporter permease, partial [Candidatus Limnocylindrales bacterium]|nr:ABC transporter permease [Candidatus Limnocylindrales bacterium]